MSVLLSKATGNWLTASTWGLVDPTSFARGENAAHPLTILLSGTRSSPFTPGAITIDAIAVMLNVRTGVTGTIKVQLEKDSDDSLVVGTDVTINCADLPATTAAGINGGWIVFKFAAPVTLAAATAYQVAAMTSTASMVSLWRFDATAANISRALRTTTNQAPVAGDDVIVAGEKTGAGTNNAFTVTMDETATTDYGSNTNSLITPAVAVCQGSTLKWKDTSAANPLLRLSGHLIVYDEGTLNIGTIGTPIPRDSVAVLEFDPAADGDMGLVVRNLGNCNMQGLSRTSGKNVSWCLLNADNPISRIGSLLAVAPIVAVLGNVTSAQAGFGPAGLTITGEAQGITDNVTNGVHAVSWTQLASITNTTQVFSVWIKAGSGTNKRYVRMQLGSVAGTLGNGFYADIDLQLGTIGTCTGVGLGTGTSSAITALAGGYICTIIGIASSGALSPKAALLPCNAVGVFSYVGDTTQNFIYCGQQLYTAAALPSADLTVDTDTGWLTGDIIIVAPTTRTRTDFNIVELASSAGASTLTPTKVIHQNHSGTSPARAEVINLTRNVRIRSTNSAIMAYVVFAPTSIVDIDWVQFYYLGTNVATKRGVEIQNTTGTCSISYCSLHDMETGGFFISAASGNVITLEHNVLWNVNNLAVAGTGGITNVASSGITTINDNVLILCGLIGLQLADVGCTVTNNRISGCTTVGINLGEAAAVGTFTGNVSHSNTTDGIGTIAGLATSSTSVLSGCSSWRNAGRGLSISAAVLDLIFDTWTMFGNTNSNIFGPNTGIGDITLKGCVLNGDTSFPTLSGIDLASTTSGAGVIRFDSCDFSTVSGILTAHTQDINVISVVGTQVFLRNTKLAAATEVLNQANFGKTGGVFSQKHDQVAGSHKSWLKGGTISTDSQASPTPLYNTAAPSMRMAPISASIKLESGIRGRSFQAAVANGQVVQLSAYVRKSVVGDGAAYNGNQPRLVVRANPALGISSDTVLATGVAANGSWEQLSANAPAPTDDGVLEFVVDCDGTAGWVNVDDLGVAEAA